MKRAIKQLYPLETDVDQKFVETSKTGELTYKSVSKSSAETSIKSTPELEQQQSNSSTTEITRQKRLAAVKARAKNKVIFDDEND